MAKLLGGTLQQLAQDRGVELSALQGLNPGLDPNTTFTASEVKFLETQPEAQIDISQPSPTQIQQPQDLFRVPTGSKGPQGEQIFDVFSPEGHIESPDDPRLKGVDIAGLLEGQAPTGFKSKFEKAFEQADKVGGKGQDLVDRFAPTSQDRPLQILQQDPFIRSLVTAFQDFISPVSQRTLLKEEYQQMLKDTGIQDIDMELVDMKAVIDGTEDDLRTEITKSGGFATNSQVLTLTNARNKQLIKNYNQLLDIRNAKEKYLNTMIGLEQADRTAADQRFESAFNMGTQIFQLQQQMQTNARNQMQWLATNVGFDGLYDATGGDPFTIGLVESSLGIPRGGLLSTANQARLAKAQAEKEVQLDLDLKRSQLETEQLRQEEIRRDLIVGPELKTSVVDVGGRKYLINSQTGKTIREIAPGSDGTTEMVLAQAQNSIQNIDALKTHAGMSKAVGPRWYARLTPFKADVSTGQVDEFLGSITPLISQLTLDKLIEAKEKGATFGALDRNEWKALEAAGTKIGAWVRKDEDGNITHLQASEKSVKAELDKISNFAKLDYVLKGGKPEEVGVMVTPDGKYWTQNSDGSMTQIR